MAIRVKTQWHQETNKTPEDIGSVLAFNTWKVAVQAVDHIGDEDFHFETVPQRFAVLEEFLVFLIQVTDRWAHQHWDDDKRRRLITAMVLRLAETLQDNQTDWIGPADYRTIFIDRFNQRAVEYADFAFTDNEPGYQFRRYLGERVMAVMGEKTGNRWVIDQVMDIEIPEALKTAAKSFQGLVA